MQALVKLIAKQTVPTKSKLLIFFQRDKLVQSSKGTANSGLVVERFYSPEKVDINVIR